MTFAWTLILGTAALSGLVDCLPDALPDIRPVGPVFVSVSVSDPVEHESSHELHSQLRKRFGNPTVYVGEGKAVVVPSIRGLTLRAVADAVLPGNRGPVYSLYLRQAQRWWNSEPLYVLDEHGAYLNGTLWYRSRNRAADAAYSLDRAAELASYADTLLMLARKQPGYDVTQLAALLDYQRGRLEKMRTSSAVEAAPNSRDPATATDEARSRILPGPKSDPDGQQEALRRPSTTDDPWSGTVVVFFGAPWCAPCKAMAPMRTRLNGKAIAQGWRTYYYDVSRPPKKWREAPPKLPLPFVILYRNKVEVRRWQWSEIEEKAIEKAAIEEACK